MALVRTEYDINSFLELIRYTVRTRASFPDPPPTRLWLFLQSRLSTSLKKLRLGLWLDQVARIRVGPIPEVILKIVVNFELVAPLFWSLTRYIDTSVQISTLMSSPTIAAPGTTSALPATRTSSPIHHSPIGRFIPKRQASSRVSSIVVSFSRILSITRATSRSHRAPRNWNAVVAVVPAAE